MAPTLIASGMLVLRSLRNPRTLRNNMHENREISSALPPVRQRPYLGDGLDHERPGASCQLPEELSVFVTRGECVALMKVLSRRSPYCPLITNKSQSGSLGDLAKCTHLIELKSSKIRVTDSTGHDFPLITPSHLCPRPFTT
jgi:hypothetical protein